MAFEYEYEWRADGAVVGSLQSLNLSGLAGKNISGRVRARNAGSAWSGWVSATGGGVVLPLENIYGFNPNLDEGEDGDIFVSKTGNDDTGDGSVDSPYLTISKAASVVSHGQTIRLRAGVWREVMSLAGKGSGDGVAWINVARYRKERAVISGFEVATGWTPCTSVDAGIVGSSYQNIYKITMEKSAFASGNPATGNFHEAGARLDPAAVKTPFPLKTWTNADTDDWLVSDETVVVDGKIIGYRHAETTRRFTEAQIKGATFNFHAAPNTHVESTVTSIIDGVMLLADQTKPYEANSKKDRFALVNIPAAMTRGTWAYYDLGNGSVDVFVWPRSPSSMASGIEYSVRGIGVDCRGTDRIEIRGIVIEGQASAGSAPDMLYAVAAGNTVGSTPREGLRVINCDIANTWRAGDGYAPIMVRSFNQAKIFNCSIRNAVGQFAVFALGGNYNSSGTPMDGTVMHRCFFTRTEKAATRLYGQWGARVSQCLFVECGSSAHSNKGNSYEGCRRNLFAHNIFWGCGGYLTWQESSSIDFYFNFVPASYAGTSRAIVDQNDHDMPNASPATVDQVIEVSHVVNNGMPPGFEGHAYFNSLQVGSAKDPYVRYAVSNNIMHGASQDAAYIDGWGRNLYTGGAPFDATDETATIGAVWADVLRGDLSIKPTSPSWAMVGRDLTETVAALQSRYPDYGDFTKDLVGAAFDPASPPVGPLVAGNSLPALPPVWVQRPKIIGNLEPGAVLSSDMGYCCVHPFTPPARQWIRSNDGWDTWENIPGATAESYTIHATNDTGWRIGLISTVAGSSVVTPGMAPVADYYPIKTPQRVAMQKYATLGKNLSVPGVTSTGKPLLLVSTIRLGTTADNTLTVSTNLGTFVLADRFRRNACETQLWVCLNPVVGAGDITISALNDCQQAVTQVFEIDGLTGFGGRGTAGSTSANTYTSAVSTTGTRSLVLHLFMKYTGNTPGNEMVISGANTLAIEDSSPSTSTSAITIGIGYEQMSDPGSASAYAAWTNPTVSAWLSLELLS